MEPSPPRTSPGLCPSSLSLNNHSPNNQSTRPHTSVTTPLTRWTLLAEEAETPPSLVVSMVMPTLLLKKTMITRSTVSRTWPSTLLWSNPSPTFLTTSCLSRECSTESRRLNSTISELERMEDKCCSLLRPTDENCLSRRLRPPSRLTS